MNKYEFGRLLAGYNHISLDLGTGDGRYVRTLAERHPERFSIGVDACRENLREHSRGNICPTCSLSLRCAQELAL